jgi:hypothetical protein
LLSSLFSPLFSLCLQSGNSPFDVAGNRTSRRLLKKFHVSLLPAALLNTYPAVSLLSLSPCSLLTARILAHVLSQSFLPSRKRSPEPRPISQHLEEDDRDLRLVSVNHRVHARGGGE